MLFLNDETLEQMQEEIGKLGYPVITSKEYGAMVNYETIDQFLRDCIDEKESSAVLYDLSSSGGISRQEVYF